MRRLLLLFALLIGCDDTPAKPLPTVADYENAAVTALCQYLQRCGEISPSQQSGCRSLLTQELSVNSHPYSIVEAVSSGRIAYDGAAGRSCVDSFASSECNLAGLFAIGDSAACQNVSRGLVPAGGSCQATGECDQGFCDQGTHANPGCPGTCRAFAATGAACDGVTQRCGPTDYCGSMTRICTTLGVMGAACLSGSECGKGLDCRGGSCQGPGAQGAPCTSGFSANACKPGLFCDSSAQPPACKPRQSVGGSCLSAAGCIDGLVCANLNGVATPTCQPVADVGQSCADNGCAGDAACDATSQTCKLVGQLGDNCATSGCGLELYCDDTQKCAMKVHYGAACDPATDSPCLSGECSDATLTCTLVCS